MPNPPRTTAFATAVAVVQTGVYYGIWSMRFAVSTASLGAHATPAANSLTAGPRLPAVGPWDRDPLPHPTLIFPKMQRDRGLELGAGMELSRLWPSHLAEPRPQHGAVP